MRAILLCLALVIGCSESKSTPGPGSGSGAECQPSECGPRLGMPARKCPDGSIGGNTGRCLRRADGSCGWEIRECPPIRTVR